MNNVEDAKESVLLVFGGLVTEVNPYDVPAGSSPICTDMDFTVQSTKTRDGLMNVYSYEGNSQTKTTQSGTASGTGHAWSNPNHITTDTPGTYATVALNTVAGFGTIFEDDFATDPDQNPLSGQDWAQFSNFLGSSNSPLQVVSGKCEATTGSGANNTQAWLGNAPVDCFAQFTLAAAPANTSSVAYVLYRFDNTNGNGYGYLGLLNYSFGNWVVTTVRVINGIANNFINPTIVGATLNPGDVFTYACIGSAHYIYYNGTLVAQNNDTSLDIRFSGPNSIALGCTPSGATSNIQFSDFQAGSTTTGTLSGLLNATAFAFTVPSSSFITGVEVTVNGKQSTTSGETLLSIVPITQNFTPVPRSFQLQTTDGSFTTGGPIDTWDQYWTAEQVNNSSFGFSIQASAFDGTPVTFDISGVVVTVWYTPPGIQNFHYVKTLQFTDGQTLTLALDDSGVFWQEDVDNDPSVLVPFYTAIEPDTFAKSVTLDDREFIALSDLAMGTDMPRQYNGQWVDRISQVGPAAAPSVTFNTTEYGIVSITQVPATFFSGNDYTFVWSANAGTTASGNTISIQAHTGLLADVIAAGVGSTVVLAGIPNQNGQDPNGTYTVVACGTVPTADYGPASPYFSVTAAVSNRVDAKINTGSYQLTVATLTTSATVPNLQVNGQMTIADSSQSAYDGTWTVTATPNASQMSITDTSLTGNVANYVFDLITGTAPVVGQQATVTGTTNGNGIFNVANAYITAASTTGSPPTGGTFSIQIIAANVPGASEEGNAIVNGTIFQFDPGQIIGNAIGQGNVVVTGGLGAGTRGCVVMFLTRNGFLTAPSPQAIFTLNEDASSITVSNIPTGPPNVIARVLAFTGAGGATQTGGGGFYFWIPSPVTVVDNGQNVVYSATIINDNVTTQQTFTFTDAVLLAADSITDQGNNNFAQIELGSCLGVIAYSSRLFAWGEQNKVNNLLNYSFDGGIVQSIGSVVQNYPAGWVVDPTYGGGGSVTVSPLFGNAYEIANTTGSTIATLGLLSQGAYHDVVGGAPIIQSGTTYSVRVTASCPSGTESGSIQIGLYSPTINQGWGSFGIALSDMTTEMQIFTGTLLTTPFAIVPSDLLIHVYGSEFPAAATVLIDRIEVFPTMQPVLSTQLRVSYFDNFEAFDEITGNLGVGAQNQQPVTNAFSLFDNLYLVKSKSLYSTTDNGVTEPDGWTVREVSNKVGTPSIYGVDVGEGWALVCGQAGLYLFEGGEPIKINPELDGEPGLWQSINWTYGNTIWLRNDTEKRKIYIGVPIPTPNQWMPKFPANANPTQPNVVLCCVYKELMTSGALAGEGPLRVTYTGDLKTFALGRKWSAWSIEACYADFITRPDTTDQIFYCGDADTGKIYQQITGNYADDGQGMFSDYYSYAFPKSQEAQQSGMGLTELEATYMTLLVQGSGELDVTIIPNAIGSQDAEALYPVELNSPPRWDTELPLNQIGNRFFLEFSVDKPFEWFELSRVVMALGPSPWAPCRGINE